MTHLWNQRFDVLERVLEAEKKKQEKKMSKVLSKDGAPIAFDRSGQDHGAAGDVLMPVLVEFFIG